MTQVEKSEASNNRAEASNTKSEAANAKAAGKPHKKSKTIIVVNNPQNSRMRNSGSGNNDRRSGGRGNEGGEMRLKTAAGRETITISAAGITARGWKTVL